MNVKMLFFLTMLLASCIIVLCEIVTPFISSNPCISQKGDCGYSRCEDFQHPIYGCFPSPAVSTCPIKTFYFPQQNDYISVLHTGGICIGEDTYKWCCKGCPKGSKYYVESADAAYCVKCDTNAVVYKHSNLKGGPCVISPLFVPKLDKFIGDLQALSVSANATACGLKTTDRYCTFGHYNDDYRIGQAVDLTMYKGNKIFLKDACGDPNKLSVIEKKILEKAKNAGLIWGRSYSNTRCNHFEITGPNPKLHNTPEYATKIKIFQKALKDQCTPQCSSKSLLEQKCLCESPPVTTTVCASGLRPCYGRNGLKCINTASDPLNCGTCSNVCLGDTVCKEGKCICNPGLKQCYNDVCADVTSNSLNCGDCGVSCFDNTGFGTGQCIGGTCECAPGYTFCSLQCIRTVDDSRNCGSCNTICAVGEGCVNGTCIACSPGLTLCGDTNGGQSFTCIDLKTNSNNCGGCNTPCFSGGQCVGGKCTCPPDATLCKDGNDFLSCVREKTDSYNCGACNKICPAGGQCTGGKCVCPTGTVLCANECSNRTIDSYNCGRCGHHCKDNELCVDGKCICQSGFTSCNGSCVDTVYGLSNCGRCGNKCPTHSYCSNGVCYKVSSICSDDVEFCKTHVCTDKQVDAANCGKCGKVCALYGNCVKGKCTCPKNLTFCKNTKPCSPFLPNCNNLGYACVDTKSDRTNCGKCGNFCTAYSRCVNSKCDNNFGQLPNTSN